MLRAVWSVRMFWGVCLLHQAAHQLGVVGRVGQGQVGDDEGLVIEDLDVVLGLLLVLVIGLAEGLERGGLRVQLQDLFGAHGEVPAHLVEVFLHLQGNRAIGGEADGAALQDLGDADLGDIAFQRLLGEVQQVLVVLLGLLGGGFLRVGDGQGILVGHRDEGLS